MCIIGGTDLDKFTIVGKYEEAGCDQLHPMYASNNGYSIRYDIRWNEYWIVDDNDNENTTIWGRCTGFQLEDCIGSDAEWSILNPVTREYQISSALITSDCTDVENSCHVNYDYCLSMDDEGNNGTFELECCDQNQFPVFYDNKNDNKMSFDLDINSFIIYDNKNSTNIFAYCNALLLDECDGFWSKNVTLSQCNEWPSKDTKIVNKCQEKVSRKKLNMFSEYWYLFPFGIGIVIIGCIGCIWCGMYIRKIIISTDPQRRPLVPHHNIHQGEEGFSFQSEMSFSSVSRVIGK